MTGSSGPLQQRRRMSISCSGSQRVPIAQIKSSVFDGSLSSSTTTTKRPRYAPAWHCDAMTAACLAWPGYLCLIETTIINRLPPDTVSQTPLTSGTPAFSISSQISAERRKGGNHHSSEEGGRG